MLQPGRLARFHNSFRYKFENFLNFEENTGHYHGLCRILRNTEPKTRNTSVDRP